MAAFYNSVIRAGRQWKLDLTWKRDGAPVDITDYTGWALRSAAPLSLDLQVGTGLSIPDAPGGRVVALLTAGLSGEFIGPDAEERERELLDKFRAFAESVGPEATSVAFQASSVGYVDVRPPPPPDPAP